jgi:hypothetical protein
MDLTAHDKLIKTWPAGTIVDGPIVASRYELAAPRIMWVLREAHENNRGDIPDYRELVRNKKELFHYRYWRRTIGRVAKVSGGTLGGCLPYAAVTNDSNKLHEFLLQIAVVNVNKAGGKRSSNSTLMQQAADEYGSTILRQVEFLDPHIIIFAGTFGYLKNSVPALVTFDQRLNISACHPNQRSVPFQQYYEKIVGDVQRRLPESG